MIRPIVLYNAPVLRERAERVSLESPYLSELIQDLWDTMYNAKGVGLAAPQIGYALSVFVVDASPFAEEFPEEVDIANFKEVFINPEILEYSTEHWDFEEGCLSIPGVRALVSRPQRIAIRFYDQNFTLREETFSGIIARIIQHEYDHLQGILFIDKLPPVKKQILFSKLKRIQKGKVDTSYPVLLGKRAPLYRSLVTTYGASH